MRLSLALIVGVLASACGGDATPDSPDASCGSGFYVGLDGVAPTEIVIDETDDQLRLDTRMFTVELWARLEIGGQVSVQRRGERVGGGASDSGWEVSMTTEQILVAVHGEAATRAINIADRVVEPGWHHLAFSWDRGQSLAFLDGARVQPTDCGLNGDLDGGEVCLYTTLAPAPTDGPIRIGAAADTNGALTYSAMGLDELRISNTPRYVSESFVPAARFEVDASTLLLLHFDEGAGTQSSDASGNNHTANLVGSADWRPGDGFEGSSCEQR